MNDTTAPELAYLYRKITQDGNTLKSDISVAQVDAFQIDRAALV